MILSSLPVHRSNWAVLTDSSIWRCVRSGMRCGTCSFCEPEPAGSPDQVVHVLEQRSDPHVRGHVHGLRAADLLLALLLGVLEASRAG